MRIDIITLFPEMIETVLASSISGRARESGIVSLRAIDLREFTTDRHRTADDTPYGGGGGMVMKVEPIALAMDRLRAEGEAEGWGAPRVLLTDPRGSLFTQQKARAWAKNEWIVLLCGHYEGVDERVRLHIADEIVSIGDFVLTGGELPALTIADALTRLQPGALGDAEAPEKDSFADNLLEYPHYTRPAEFRGWRVPEMLLCGHHARIMEWRRWQSLQLTKRLRPDVLARHTLDCKDRKLMAAAEPDVPPGSKTVSAAMVTETNSIPVMGRGEA